MTNQPIKAYDESPYSPSKLRTALDSLGLLNTLTEQETQLSISYCQSMQLNPIRGDVHIVKYNTKKGPVLQFILPFEYYIKKAQQHPEYNGYNIELINEDSLQDLGANITIHYKNWNSLKWPTIYYHEVKNDQNPFMWDKRPRFMLSKTALVQVLKFAFQIDGDGQSEFLTVNEPTTQSQAPPPPQPPEPTTQSQAKPISEKQKGFILKLIKSSVFSDAERADFETQIDDLTTNEASDAISNIKQVIADRKEIIQAEQGQATK